MKTGLWVAQVLLALVFGAAGTLKTLTPAAELAQTMPWVAHVPDWLPRVAGISEVLGALGLILPSALRIKPVLTPIAAAGLVLVMVLAGALHASLGEFQALPANLTLAGLAAFVWWGRTKALPIDPR